MKKQFSWEQEYKRTWEDIPHKKIDKLIRDVENTHSNNRKGMVRHLHVMIDVSEAIDKSDFPPTFRTNVTKVFEEFIPLFYNENPLSMLSFLSVRDVCVKYSDDFNIDIRSFLGNAGSKWFSLLNGLEGSMEIIKGVPHIKEILVVTASTSTRDPHEYTEVFEKLKAQNIKVHIVSLCGEISLYKSIAKTTDGKFRVPVDQSHLTEIMRELCYPSDFNGTRLNLVKIGFPQIKMIPSVCVCHLEMRDWGYECPVCNTMICSLPMNCPICTVKLVSILNISKAQCFLYPIKPFVLNLGKECRICSQNGSYQCSDCKSVFCDICNDFIHNNLCFCMYCDGY